MRFFALALALTSALNVVAPLAAQTSPTTYYVRLATPIARATTLSALGEVEFRCEADRCTADQSSFGRTMDLCVDVARQVGPVMQFAVRGRDAGERLVERCNRRAGHG